MDEQDWLTARFEENRDHLQRVAYRMLGSAAEAQDAVQEAWLRLSRAGTGDVRNLSGWLTTVVARVCLDMLRRRRSRREEPFDPLDPRAGKPSVAGAESGTAARRPDQEALLADSIGIALLVVLERLTPAERVAFVLHDLFDLPFDEVGPIIDRTPAAARQLASRARRRVQGIDQDSAVNAMPDRDRQRTVVEAFLEASREGDFGRLLSLLDPGVVVRADGAAVRMGAPEIVRGAPAVAKTFAGRARAAQPALVDGMAGLVWAVGGTPRVVFRFVTAGGQVLAIEMLADLRTLQNLDLVMLRGPRDSEKDGETERPRSTGKE
ncbi:MAG: sigma-70 family RNA polymerase sigma factor [Candidatus Eisenbacteria bacterium]|nr:sigma-70 family RNA polymerase sigma factor [Candidatus Eisenbacteria bacterium]